MTLPVTNPVPHGMHNNGMQKCTVQHTPAAFNAVKLDMVLWASLSVLVVTVRLQKEKKRLVWLQV